MEATTETGASSWLLAISLKDHDFYLNKQSLWDTLYLRYGIDLPRLPSRCVCDSKFDVEHALNCKKGGFVTIHHNDVRDFMANMLTEVCKDVCKEPSLVPLTGETFNKKTTITDDEARVDVSARGFWTRGNKAFLMLGFSTHLPKVTLNKTLSQLIAAKNKKRKESILKESLTSNMDHLLH